MEINGAIRDVLKLTRDEVTKNGVSVLTHFAEPSPTVQADRAQLQQVILSLIINAVQAMSSMRKEARELLICTEKEESNGARVAVRDSGPGLHLKSVDRLLGLLYYQGPRRRHRLDRLRFHHRGARRADVGRRMNLGAPPFSSLCR